jgi:hypothetical protein
MAVSTTKMDEGHELALEVALIRLAKAVDRLTGSVRELADKEHLNPVDRDERYRSILDSLTQVSGDLQDVAEALTEDERE